MNVFHPTDTDAGAGRRPAHPRRRSARSLALVTVALGSLLAACSGLGISPSGGGTSPSGAASPASSDDLSQQLLAYSQCMRDNGVPNFPDPRPGGGIAIDGNQVDTDSPVYKAAEETCQALLPPPPAGGEDDPADREQMLAYAACMRENGVPNFADPEPGGGLNLDGDVIDIDSPAFKAAEEACASLPGAPGGDINEQTGPGGGQP
jgi:hypothetical protein